MFCRTCVNLDLSGAFLMIRLGVGVWEGIPQGEVLFFSHCIRNYVTSICLITDEIKISQLGKIAFVSFLHHKVTHFPFPNSVLWKQVLSAANCLLEGMYVHILLAIII